MPGREIEELLNELWRDEQLSAPDLELALPGWIDLVASYPPVALQLDPRDLALDMLSSTRPDLSGSQPPRLVGALTRHVARDQGGRGPRTRAALEQMLLAAPARGEAWAMVAAALGRYRVSPSLADACLDWVEQNHSSSLAPSVVHSAARVDARSHRALEVYRSYGRPTAGWAQVGAALARPNTRAEILEQLRSQLPDWRSGYLLAALLKSRQIRDPALLRGWLRMHGTSPLVLPVLHAALPGGWAGDELVGETIRRVSGTTCDLIAESILRADPASVGAAVSSGLFWLDHHQAAEWSVVWEACWARSAEASTRQRLQHSLERGLTEHSSVATRTDCWRLSVDRGLLPDRQMAIGLALADETVGHAAWVSVFEVCWDRWPDERGRLLEAAWRQLDSETVVGFAWANSWLAIAPRLRGLGDPALNGRCAALPRRFLHGPPPVRGFGLVWQELTDVDGPDDELLQLAQRVLDGPASPDLIRVWRILWELAPGDVHLARTGREYTRSLGWHRGISYVLDALLADDPSDELVQIGLTLVATEHNNDGVPHMIGALAKVGAPTRDLVPAACEFLRARPDHTAVGYVWSILHDRAPTDPRVLEVGRWIVREHPEGEIGSILLSDSIQLDADEIERAVANALQHPETKTFAHLWSRAWEESPGDPLLIESGRRYLREVRDGDGFGYVWPTLWSHSPDELARDAGIEFLVSHPGHPAFGHVFEPLWSKRRIRPRILETALDLVCNYPLHSAFGRVWGQLWRSRPNEETRAMLIGAGLQHLSVGVEHHSFPWVWRPLQTDCPELQAELVESGLTFVALRPHPKGFVSVFERLWHHRELRDQILPHGLAFVSSGNPRASYTWVALDQSDPGNLELRAAGFRILASRQFQAQAFGQLWQRLAATPIRPSEEAAFRAGAEVLVSQPQDANAPLAWAYLLREDGTTPSLRAAGSTILARHDHTMPELARRAFESAGFQLAQPPPPPPRSWHWFTCCSCWETTGAEAPETGRFTVRVACAACGAELIARRHDHHIDVALADPDQ